jgi:hypothetical protein
MSTPSPTRRAANPRSGPPTAVIAAILAGLGAAFAGCSSVPSRHWPQHRECTVIADYPVVDSQPIEVPASHPGLTILEFACEPPCLGEQFADGRRWLQPPPDCTNLTVRCRLRVYAHGDLPPAPPAQLFPGATIRFVP